MYQTPVPIFSISESVVPIPITLGYFAPLVPGVVPSVLIPAPLNYFKFVPLVPNSHFSFLSGS